MIIQRYTLQRDIPIIIEDLKKEYNLPGTSAMIGIIIQRLVELISTNSKINLFDDTFYDPDNFKKIKYSN